MSSNRLRKTLHYIEPYFVVKGENKEVPIKNMPGVFRLSCDNIIKSLKEKKSTEAILLFGIPEKKDERGTESYASDGAVQAAVEEIRKEFKGLYIITDVCLCAYTAHGHCGIMKDEKIDNEVKVFGSPPCHPEVVIPAHSSGDPERSIPVFDCGNSGTTLSLLMGLNDSAIQYTGDESLQSRSFKNMYARTITKKGRVCMIIETLVRCICVKAK